LPPHTDLKLGEEFPTTKSMYYGQNTKIEDMKIKLVKILDKESSEQIRLWKCSKNASDPVIIQKFLLKEGLDQKIEL
jgi:hypothetical protein